MTEKWTDPKMLFGLIVIFYGINKIMSRYRRSYTARSNRGKFGEVLLHNLLAGSTKAEKQQEEREQRVANVLRKHGLSDLKPREILRYARDNSISIDQIEKRIVLPEIRRRLKREFELQKMSDGDRAALAIMAILKPIGNVIGAIAILVFLAYVFFGNW